MNKRIKELARQTDIIDVDLLNESQCIMLQKFAQLIVRECAQLALDEQQRYRDISHRDMIECAVAMSNYQLLLKEHFGLEE